MADIQQRINFLQALKGEEKVTLCFAQIQKYCLLLFILLLFVLAFQFWKIQATKIEAKKLDQEKAQLLVKRKNLEKETEANKDAIDHNIFLAKSLDARKQLLSSVEQLEQQNAIGLAPYLRGLSEAMVSGVWLTRIQLQQGGAKVILSGQAKRTEDVVQFLQRLKQSSVYRPLHLRILSLSQAVGVKPLDFVINNELTQGNDGIK